MRFIGITGGVGAGKTEILNYIKKHYKCQVYLADEVAHQVKQAGTDCYKRLLLLLGEDILDSTGEIDKSKMADKIFADAKLVEEVNNIIHPAVKDYLLEKWTDAKENHKTELFFVEAALLIEAGYKKLVDEMWYIHADENIRKKRLTQSRAYTDARINGIMEKQLSEKEFRENSDFIIDNSGELADTYRQIDKKLEAFTWQE